MEDVNLIWQIMMKFWQFTVLGVLIIIGGLINISDKINLKGKVRNFKYDEYPHMQPIRINTAGKGFWGAIWLWMMTTRTWTISKDFHYKLNGKELVIPEGFTFDGASVPKFLASFLSPVGVLLIGGLIHDYGYKYTTLLSKDKKSTTRTTWRIFGLSRRCVTKQPELQTFSIAMKRKSYSWKALNYTAKVRKYRGN